MALKKRVRIVKKIRDASGVWRFVSLKRAGDRYIWDDHPGYYFLDWREGRKRCRQLAGNSPSQALEARHRKQNELLGEMINGNRPAPLGQQSPITAIQDAIKMHQEHVRTHSPDKPKTLQRYAKVHEHSERILGHKNAVEVITRVDIEQFKITRSSEFSQQHPRQVTPRTVNFEVGVLRAFFNYLINERGPCLWRIANS